MKAALYLLLCLPLLAQQPAAPTDAASPAPSAKPSPAQPPAAGPDAASPVPSTEPALTGWIDLGYRWRTDVGGSFDTYRSIVNLGSGPKFLGTDFTLADPKHRWFDPIQVRANSWGDEPSSSAASARRKNPASTISTPTIATSRISTFCRPTPIRCSAVASS